MPHIDKRSLVIRLKRELPPTAPIPAILQTSACRWMPLSYFEWCRARYGNAFTVYPVDMSPAVFLSSPEDIQAVVNAPAHALHPGAGGAAIAPIVGERSFMLREQDEHLSGRRATSPAFSGVAAQRHANVVAEIVEREVESWPLDTVFPVHPRLLSLTLKVILRTVFGEAETVALRELHNRILEMLSVTVSFVLVEPRLRCLPGWSRTWRRFVRDRRAVDGLISELIARARNAGAEEHTVLDGLLETHNVDGTPLSDREVRDQVMSVILAGHETTASELAWAFQLLAHNATVQSRLIDEIEGDGEEYLSATVQEVLRHRPVFLFAIPRVVVEPIEIGGWTYRPPTQLFGCIYLMHHDPALHPDPHRFRPERFLGAQLRVATWMPWGGGRKRCPGHHLATLEMRTVLREVLAKCRIEPAGARIERARWRSVIVTPGAGSRIVLRPRRRPGRAASSIS
jgi:cytochrome P450